MNKKPLHHTICLSCENLTTPANARCKHYPRMTDFNNIVKCKHFKGKE